VRGNTYWIADGTYNGTTIEVPGTTLITIKKAASVTGGHGPDAGWLSAYGDGQAIFNGHPNAFIINNYGYIVFDGTTPFTNQGFRVNMFLPADPAAFAGGSFHIDYSVSDVNNMTWKSVYCQCYANNGTIIDNPDYPWIGQASAIRFIDRGTHWHDNYYLTNCVISGYITGLMLPMARHAIIENSEFANIGVGGGGTAHPNVVFLSACDYFTFRYNKVHDCNVLGIGSGVYNTTGTYIYGNVAWDCEGDFIHFYNRTGITHSDIRIYNNVGANLWFFMYGSPGSMSGYAYNNIIYNCEGTVNWGGLSADYNWYSGSDNQGETHGVIGGSVDPFVNLAGKDFHIKATIGSSYPRNRGVILGSPYNKDADGNTRGADGAWDIGAYEYGGANTNPVISVVPDSLSSTFGLGTTNSVILQVQNAGGDTLAGTASIIGAPGVFTILSGQTYSLTAGQSQQVEIQCVPATTNDGAIIRFPGGGGKDVPVTNHAQLPLGLSFAAAAGIVTPPFVASGGYVSQAVTTGVTEGGQASYTFTITNAGNYAVSALVSAPHSGANSLYVNMDGMPVDPAMIWDVPVAAGFANRTVSWRGSGTDVSNEFDPKVFNLTAGVHQLVVIGREANVQLGQITIAPYTSPRPTPPPPPGNLRGVASQ